MRSLVPFFVTFFWALGAFAGDRDALSVRALSAISPVAPVSVTDTAALVRPSPLGPDDEFYHDYFSSLDTRISREYGDKWNYHNLQTSYVTTTGDVRHLTPGSLEFYNDAPREVDARRAFADQVLRLRFDSALRSYFRPANRATGIKSAEKALNSLKNQAVSLGGTPDKPAGQLRVGYDIFTDFAKVDYVGGPIEGGLYHSFFLSAAAGARSNGRPVFAQLVARPGGTLPVPTLRYRFDNQSVEASLAKQLTKSVTGSLVSTQPTLANGVAKSYGLSVSYSF